MLNFAKHSEQALLNYLSHLGREDAVLSYHQIQGLLYAMSSSPEPIKPSEWFELIWLSDDPHFDDATEAKAFYQLLVELSRHIGDLAKRQIYRPGLDDTGKFSFDAMGDWCEGFLMGHQYLENIWLIALDDLSDEQMGWRVEAVLMWAVNFIGDLDASDLGESNQRDRDERDADFLASQLEFQQLLGDYYEVHELWHQGAFHWDVEKSFQDMQAAGREELCPCGSGRLFGQCCLH